MVAAQSQADSRPPLVCTNPTPLLNLHQSHTQVNNGTHEITATCTTIVRDLSQSPKNPKGTVPPKATVAVVGTHMDTSE